MQIYTEKVMAPADAGLAPLVRIMHKTAKHDLDVRGVGMADMQAKGITWVLTQLTISVLRYPEAGEALTCATWPTAPYLGIYPRRYELRDKSGAAVITMCAIWMVMDVNSRKLADLARCSVDLGETAAEKVRPAHRIHLPSGGTFTHFTPELRQIDENEHLNNVEYIEIAERELPAAPNSVHMEFEHEIRFGETVELRCVQADGGYYFEGRTDNLCFRALFR